MYGKFAVVQSNHIDNCVFKTKEFQILYWTLLLDNTYRPIWIFYTDISVSLSMGDK